MTFICDDTFEMNVQSLSCMCIIGHDVYRNVEVPNRLYCLH